MKRLLMLLPLLLFGTTASATDWYFSNCSHVTVTNACELSADNATCDGDIPAGGTAAGNPWCLDPDDDSTDESIGYLMDDTGDEYAANDMIYLCAGACDGSGSGVFLLEAAFFFNTNGPLTIQPYAGETVAFEGGGAAGLQRIMGTNSGIADITIKNLTMGHSDEYIVNLNSPSGDWVFDGVELAYVGELQTDVGIVDAGGSGCGKASLGNAYAFFVSGSTGNITFKNGSMHHICKFAVRQNNNNAQTSFLVENNTFYNTAAVNNDFDSINVTFRNNLMYDNENGLSIEDRTEDWIVEDNTIICRWDYNVKSNGACENQLRTNEGDFGSTHHGKQRGMTIRRNLLYGEQPRDTDGHMYSAIVYEGTCDTAKGCINIDCLIENNMVWFVHPNLTGQHVARSGIGVDTNKGCVIQGNTVYYSAYPFHLEGASHTFRNNLSVRGELAPEGTNEEELWVVTDANGSDISDNNLYDNGAGGNVANVGGIGSYSCSQVNDGTFDAAVTGSGNVCQSVSFVNVSGGKETWDLHLTADTDDGDCSTGPTEDFDQGSRASACDIGADEYGSPAGSLQGGAMTGGAITLLQLKEWSCEMQKKHGVGACIP